MIKKNLTILFFILISFQANAVEERKIEDKDERIKKFETLTFYNWDDPKDQTIQFEKAKASFYITASEYYLKGKDANQWCWWVFGKGCKGDEVLIFGPDYSIYISYKDDGYVTLDDWKEVNTSTWLKEMREIAKANAEIFKKQNLEYATYINWIFKPEFNEEKKFVHYSKEVTWNDQGKSMESATLALGRKGYLSVIFVFDITPESNLKEFASIGKDFANTIKFDEGSLHTDYKSGDKIAAVGIGGLVAGTLGVKVLAKAGILAKFLPLLAKFWWIIIAPIVAIFGFAAKKDSSKVSEMDEEGATRKRKRKNK